MRQRHSFTKVTTVLLCTIIPIVVVGIAYDLVRNGDIKVEVPSFFGESKNLSKSTFMREYSIIKHFSSDAVNENIRFSDDQTREALLDLNKSICEHAGIKTLDVDDPEISISDMFKLTLNKIESLK